MQILTTPWPWYVAGPAIALIMFLLLYFGGNFGVSANLRAACAAFGGGKISDFFRYDWRNQIWNLIFVIGATLGGFIATTWLTPTHSIELNPTTVAELQSLGIAAPGTGYLPPELFSIDAMFSLKGILILVLGGIMVGFGTRYAGGCTSGHAISGLSNLQLPSLIAVIGFFAGGLIMTYCILPFLLPL